VTKHPFGAREIALLSRDDRKVTEGRRVGGINSQD
jgi:hypothetical protein